MTLAVRQDFELAGYSELIDQAETYLRASRAKSTLRAYESDLRRWVEWCNLRGVDPLPGDAGEVVLFITAEASRVTPGTIAGDCPRFGGRTSKLATKVLLLIPRCARC